MVKDIFLKLTLLFLEYTLIASILMSCSNSNSELKPMPKRILQKSDIVGQNEIRFTTLHIQIIYPHSMPHFIAHNPEQFEKLQANADYEIFISMPPSLHGKGSISDIIDNLILIPCKRETIDLRYKFSFLRDNEVVLTFYADKSGNIFLASYDKPLSVKQSDWLSNIFELICAGIAPNA